MENIRGGFVRIILFGLFAIFHLTCYSESITINVVPDHDNWIYNTGESVIFSLPQFDGKNLASWGSSQGGALSIITTSLDKRINMLVALCPAMCDFTGYLHGRAGGWPHFFNQENIKNYKTEDVLNTLPYYDVVNFARNITVPGFYSWGFKDETTPPTSFYSAYNVIKAPKHVFIIPEGQHRIYPEQTEKTNQWILDSFQK